MLTASEKRMFTRLCLIHAKRMGKRWPWRFTDEEGCPHDRVPSGIDELLALVSLVGRDGWELSYKYSSNYTPKRYYRMAIGDNEYDHGNKIEDVIVRALLENWR